jgi:flagellin-like protein
MKRKGISPLVAVIMLIALTLIISGILATWVTQLAQSQRNALEYCLSSSVLIQGAKYNAGTQTLSLYVDNRGKVDLNFTIILKYSDGTITKDSTLVPVEAGKLGTITQTGVVNTLSEATIQSDECPGAQDFVQRRSIKGLGF